MKKFAIIACAIIVLTGIIFSGCQSETTPTTATSTTSTTTTQAAPIELRFATFIPPMDVYAQQMGNWAKELEDATGGRIKITFYHSESLVKMPDLFDAVAAGTADFAMIDANMTPERLKLSGIMTLPMLFTRGSQAQQTMWSLLQKYPEFSGEYSPTRVIWCHNPGPTQLYGNKPMEKLEDLDGIKVAIVTPWEAKSLAALGMVPVGMAPTEMYTALERGTVDAASGDFNQAFIWKHFEITKYRTGNLNITQRVSPIIMNNDTYENLPADLKTIFDNVTDGLKWSKQTGEAYEEFDAFTTGEIKKADAEAGKPPFYYLPDSERQRWLDIVKPVRDEWVNEMAAQGLPAQAMLDDLMKFADQYK